MKRICVTALCFLLSIVTCKLPTESGKPDGDVLAPPLITKNPVAVTVAEGETALFSVVATGTELCYKWQLDGTDIPGAAGEQLITGPLTVADSGNGYRCIVTNLAGSDTSASALLQVKSALSMDTIPPVIKLSGGDTVRIMWGDPENRLKYYFDLVAVTDNSGGPITKSEVKCYVDIYTVNAGSKPYTIVYQYADSSGNVATATRYVYIYKAEIKDTIPPVITVVEPIMYIQLTTAFVDPGVVVYDAHDGVIPSAMVKVSGKVDSAVVGEYTLTYTVTDSAGNLARATRKVIVQRAGPDRGRPVIKLLGPDTVALPVDVAMADFIASYQEPGFKATDEVDGDITSKVRVGSFVQQSAKIWYKTYDVADAAGNAALTVKRIFYTRIIDDPEPPIIDLIYPDSIIQLILPATGPAVWREPGYAASHLKDGDITSKVIVDSSNLVANLGKTGIYTVTYTVTSSSNLKATKTRTVQIISPYDIWPPLITLLGRNPDTVLVRSVASYSEPGFIATDTRDGDITASVVLSGIVNVNTPGKYSVTYMATDKAGNRGVATRMVWVVRDTTSGSLLSRYGVPLATSLPSLVNKKYVKVEVDGDGPDISNIKAMAFNWDAATDTVSVFQVEFKSAPYVVILKSSPQTFAANGPTLTLSNSSFPALNGTYYVGTSGTEFYWVETSGKYAIVWQE